MVTEMEQSFPIWKCCLIGTQASSGRSDSRYLIPGHQGFRIPDISDLGLIGSLCEGAALDCGRRRFSAKSTAGIQPLLNPVLAGLGASAGPDSCWLQRAVVDQCAPLALRHQDPSSEYSPGSRTSWSLLLPPSKPALSDPGKAVKFPQICLQGEQSSLDCL